MKKYIEKLHHISQKQKRTILGLMSGTSLDGLDIALCEFTGTGKDTEFKLMDYETIAYTDAQREIILKVFSKRETDLQEVSLVHAYLGDLYAGLILGFLGKHKISPESIDCIASHGQTIFHSPKRLHQIPEFPDATLQIGEADRMAHKTGIITISDFRQKHIAAGGEGAPLVMYGDYILLSSPSENRILLNIGGIANFTYLPASQNTKEVFATDTGPGNCLIDEAVRKYFPNQIMDKGGELASHGNCNDELLISLMQDSFFNQKIPKTTGRELFNWEYVWDCMQKTGNTDINSYDLLNTLTCFTALIIADCIKSNTKEDSVVYLSGGGVHNLFLKSLLEKQLEHFKFNDMNRLGILPDAKEAVLFALLANETLAGEGFGLGALPAFTMGKISLP